jgi:pimeloyl-ACP methyl ester carboxylesterase
MRIDKINVARPSLPACRGRVIALHCSGAGASQWHTLAEALGGGYEVLAPEHYGCESSGPWTGEHVFTLADEAARAIALIDQSREKVHLVGHSYGGGVALHVALARPGRIASMALYEPSAFQLLRQLDELGAEAYAEIAGVSRRICNGVLTGDYRGAVAAFVDYWNGSGTWDAMRPTVQSSLIRWAPKGPLDFRALINDPTPACAYRGLNFPVLTLRGEHAPMPTRVIAECLSELLPASRLIVIDGAGHMGPLTHADEVSALIVRHIVETDAQPRRKERPPADHRRRLRRWSTREVTQFV